MTKPHEQRWEAVPTSGDVRCGDRIVAVVVHEEDERDLSQFIAAAPDMARALLAMLQAMGGIITTKAEAEAHTQAEAALKKAGVLP